MSSSELKNLATFMGVSALMTIFGAVNLAQALEFECTATGEQRFIRLEIPGKENLCEVSVTLKDGERDVKWYANNDSAFCTEKTLELKSKYEDQWGFNCVKWPDTDGVDSLNKQQRVILDTELKKLIALGNNSNPRFQVIAVKATASASSLGQPSVLALQFFRSINGVPVDDITKIIRENGLTWYTEHQLQTLSNYIPSDAEHVVNSALISTINENGDIEVSTSVSKSDTQAACYGSQTFSTSNTGNLSPRTPHRFVCQ